MPAIAFTPLNLLCARHMLDLLDLGFLRGMLVFAASSDLSPLVIMSLYQGEHVAAVGDVPGHAWA